MSLRQLRKLEKLKNQKAQEEAEAEKEDITEEAEGEGNEEETYEETTPKISFTQFAGLLNISSDDNDEDNGSQEETEAKEKQTQQQQKSKKKKNKKRKRNKKKNKQKDEEEKDQEQEEEDILNEAIQENQQELEKRPELDQTQVSVLSMRAKFFDPDREMRQRLQSKGAGKLADLEEEKGTPDEFEGLNTKQKKMMKRMQQRATNKKTLFVKPEKDWAMYNSITAYMESDRDENDNKVFKFIERDLYKEIQREFKSIQQTFDIQMMLRFLSKNFFHHETLIHVADFMRMQGKFPDSVKLIQRCMYAFEILFSKDFVICGNKPSTRIDFNSEESNLPSVFADCLVRYIDHLGRKGCCRTALEFTKFFLSLDPERDPFGNLLKIDYYALRAGEYRYLTTFAENYSNEFHSHPLQTVLFTPNILFSTAFAKYKLDEKVDNRTKMLDDAHSSVNIFVSLISEKAGEESPKILQSLYNLSADALLMLGLSFYPALVKLILIKCEVEKKPNFCKSYFKGHQKEPWSKILDHSIFDFNEDNEVLENSLGLDSDLLNKLFDLYVDRSSECYKDDEIINWMKETIGYVLNEVDEENFDREVLFQFIFNSIGLPFQLDRYSGLSKEFFNDDFTTVNPQDLLGPGADGGMGGMNPADMQQNMQDQMQNLQQMMGQGGQRVRVRQARPQVDHDNLILEEENAALEQQIILDHIANQQQIQDEDEENFVINDAGDDEVRRNRGEE
ncbi:unnamed protein product [Moneuplotes crassus]|uniref:Uncharacterized protein n=1 Tax=Euplotes crassus TaxID=5936 RepID=A0AAD1Y9M0_EUPCR|nr:unnamed protein product [Moneuplotes crassus]